MNVQCVFLLNHRTSTDTEYKFWVDEESKMLTNVNVWQCFNAACLSPNRNGRKEKVEGQDKHRLLFQPNFVSNRGSYARVCQMLPQLSSVEKALTPTCSYRGRSPQHERASRGSPSCHRPSAPSSCSSGTPPCSSPLPSPWRTLRKAHPGSGSSQKKPPGPPGGGGCILGWVFFASKRCNVLMDWDGLADKLKV